MDNVYDSIISLLDSKNIKYDLITHDPVRTSIEAAAVRNVELQFGAKSMVVKGNDKYFLFVLPADKQINWKKVRHILGTKKIRLANIEEAEGISRVKMGCVPPFGNVLNLKSFFDKSIKEKGTVYFNPGKLTHTISMNILDLISVTNPLVEDFIINP